MVHFNLPNKLVSSTSCAILYKTFSICITTVTTGDGSFLLGKKKRGKLDTNTYIARGRSTCDILESGNPALHPTFMLNAFVYKAENWGKVMYL